MARRKAKALPPKMITVYGEILQETEDGILVRCDKESDGAWLPKSQIKYDGERGDTGVEIEMPEWLANDKGFFDGDGYEAPAVAPAPAPAPETPAPAVEPVPENFTFSGAVLDENWTDDGGKLEKNETPLSCMEREAMEEAGYAGEWEELAYMHGEHSANGDPVWKCGVYYSVMAPGAELPHTCEAENIEPHRVADVPALAPEMMQHTPMLIMAALAHIRGDAFKLEVSY